jgi:hypothetical protein
MRRIEISDEQLIQIIRLRDFDKKKWSEIGTIIGVKWRIAQARYNEAKRSRNLEELKVARERVAGEALNEHVKNLLEMAEFLAINLNTPQSPREWRNTDEYINSLLERDIFMDSDVIIDKDESKRRTWYLLSERKSLLKSLRKHTPGKRWEAYDNWARAWNLSVNTLKQLRLEAHSNATALLENHPKSREIKNLVNNTNQIGEWLGETAIEAIWASVVENKLDGNNHEVTISDSLIDKGQPHEIVQATKDKSIQAQQSAKTIAQAVVKNICIGDKAQLVDVLSSSIQTMTAALDELIFGLNRHTLRAEIIQSRCELCPA